MRSLRRRLALVLLPLLLVSACQAGSTTVIHDADAVPDQHVIDQRQGALYAKYYKLLDKGLTDGHPVKGTVYKHASFGSRDLDTEWDVDYFGNPSTVISRNRVLATDPGDTIDSFHPGGSPYDYILLGNVYASVSPTGWVRVPTQYGTPVNVCEVSGYQTICDIEDALTFTMQDKKNQIVRRVTNNGDGTVTLLSGVTLAAMLKDNFLLNIPDRISKQFTKSQLSHEVPVRFVVNAKGQPEIVEIAGTFPGPTPLTVQVGFQVTGTPKASDLPKLPGDGQYTDMSTADYIAAVEKIQSS